MYISLPLSLYIHIYIYIVIYIYINTYYISIYMYNLNTFYFINYERGILRGRSPRGAPAGGRGQAGGSHYS